MKLAEIKKSKLSVKALEGKIFSERKNIELLEASVTKIFTSFASGKITKDAFLHKKEVINKTIERKRSDIEKWGEQIRNMTDGRSAAENAIAELRELQKLEFLTRDVVYLLIDKILVHDENSIEIVWNGIFGEQGENQQSC